MTALDDKKQYFDRYWHRQPAEVADQRTYQRVQAGHHLLRQKSGSLLDIGCGRGGALEYFARAGFEVTGIDISPESVARAGERGFRAFVHDIEETDIAGHYDVILCLEVLQQLFDPLRALRRMKAALKENGELIVSLPNEFHLVARLRLLLGRSHLGHFDHSHIRLFTPPRDRELFDQAGLKITDCRFMPLAPPRWGRLAEMTNGLARLRPSLWALSSIYRLGRL